MKFAVVGKPIAHSLSPAIYHAAFLATGLAASFERIEAAGAESAFEKARRNGYTGLAVTIPHKPAALKFAAEAEPICHQCGAANTLLLGDVVRAFNTDVDGIEFAIRSVSCDVTGKTVAVLGRGGAAMAAIHAVFRMGAARVLQRSRSLPRGRTIIEMGEGDARVIETADWSPEARADAMSRADLVIHATPLGLKPGDPSPVEPSWIKTGQYILDAVYRPARTALLIDAVHRGAVPIPGTRWFLGQAARQFQLFTGLEAPLQAMSEALIESPGCDWL